MTLADFKQTNGLTLGVLADLLGCKVSTLHGWISGRRTPDEAAVKNIVERTEGQVTAADLLPSMAELFSPHRAA